MKNLLFLILLFSCANLFAQATTTDTIMRKFITRTISQAGLTEMEGYKNPPITTITDSSGVIVEFLDSVSYYNKKTSDSFYIEVIHHVNGVEKYNIWTARDEFVSVYSDFIFNRVLLACKIVVVSGKGPAYPDRYTIETYILDRRKANTKVSLQVTDILGFMNIPGPTCYISEEEFVEKIRKNLFTQI